MRGDAAMQFFLELRNISQKEGPVSLVGGSLPNGRWTYRFVGIEGSIPSELIGRDVIDCGAEHLTKLAKLLLRYFEEYPLHSCVGRAMSEEGMRVLQYNLDDLERYLGFPEGYITSVPGIPTAEKLRLLQRELEPLDVQELERLAKGDFRQDGAPLEIPSSTGSDLADDIAALMRDQNSAARNPRDFFLSAIMQRISAIEDEGTDAP